MSVLSEKFIFSSNVQLKKVYFIFKYVTYILNSQSFPTEYPSDFIMKLKVNMGYN